MLFLVLKSEASQFASPFFFTTFFGFFGWGISSVFVAEERLFLAFDWNFFIAFFVTGDEILDMSERPGLYNASVKGLSLHTYL